jgi:hypothetical protein
VLRALLVHPSGDRVFLLLALTLPLQLLLLLECLLSHLVVVLLADAAPDTHAHARAAAHKHAGHGGPVQDLDLQTTSRALITLFTAAHRWPGFTYQANDDANQRDESRNHKQVLVLDGEVSCTRVRTHDVTEEPLRLALHGINSRDDKNVASWMLGRVAHVSLLTLCGFLHEWHS